MRGILVFVVLLATFSGCTTGQMPRNVYEGSKMHNESFKSTPFEKPELPSYDEYEKERRGGAARQP